MWAPGLWVYVHCCNVHASFSFKQVSLVHPALLTVELFICSNCSWRIFEGSEHSSIKNYNEANPPHQAGVLLDFASCREHEIEDGPLQLQQDWSGSNRGSRRALKDIQCNNADKPNPQQEGKINKSIRQSDQSSVTGQNVELPQKQINQQAQHSGSALANAMLEG